MKLVLPSLVAPIQSNFISGRLHDNVVIFHEVVHSMKKKKSGMQWMVFKVDFEKAYDRLRWDFLIETFIQVKFSASWISVIEMLLRSCHMRVCWDN